jgi:transcriptional regulator with XRE-family HTH domain
LITRINTMPLKELSDGSDMLRKQRALLHMTQKQLADKCGLTLYQVKKIEKNFGDLTIPVARKVCEVLGIKMSLCMVPKKGHLVANKEVCKNCNDHSCMVNLMKHLSDDYVGFDIHPYSVPQRCEFRAEHAVSQETTCQKPHRSRKTQKTKK